MARLNDEAFLPDPQHHAAYTEIYSDYLRLHDYFGRGENDVLKRLKRWRAEVRSRSGGRPCLKPCADSLFRLHQELPRNGLVAWTSGNVSARDAATGLVVIKPSGVRYEDLRPELMVIVDLEGQVRDSDLLPSSDTASHLYIYRHRPDVGGIVHTHSPYATAFAANARSIPVYLTAHADEFGGPIPCGGFAPIGRRRDRPGRRGVRSAPPALSCSRTTACSPSARPRKTPSRPP